MAWNYKNGYMTRDTLLHWDKFDWGGGGGGGGRQGCPKQCTNFVQHVGDNIRKHVSGICRVGKMMKIWKYWEDSACLCCGELVETTHQPFALAWNRCWHGRNPLMDWKHGWGGGGGGGNGCRHMILHLHHTPHTRLLSPFYSIHQGQNASGSTRT